VDERHIISHCSYSCSYSGCRAPSWLALLGPLLDIPLGRIALKIDSRLHAPRRCSRQARVLAIVSLPASIQYPAEHNWATTRQGIGEDQEESSSELVTRDSITPFTLLSPDDGLLLVFTGFQGYGAHGPFCTQVVLVVCRSPSAARPVSFLPVKSSPPHFRVRIPTREPSKASF
jgi:hypothetical protein